MPHFTHFDLLEITAKEEEMKSILHHTKKKPLFSPKKETIDNILNYSKALSIRKSKNIGYLSMILN